MTRDTNLSVCRMPIKRVHGSVEAARQAAAVWSKIQRTRERRVGPRIELHRKESECGLRLSTYHFKLQECAVQLPTINKEALGSRSRDQHVRLIRALATLVYARD